MVVNIVDSGVDDVDSDGSDDVTVEPEVDSLRGGDVRADVDSPIVVALGSRPDVVMTSSVDVVVAGGDEEADVARDVACDVMCDVVN